MKRIILAIILFCHFFLPERGKSALVFFWHNAQKKKKKKKTEENRNQKEENASVFLARSRTGKKYTRL